MGIYFFITFSVLVITFYTSFLVESYKFSESFSGLVISLFFLAIMAPGFMLNTLIKYLGRSLNVVSLAMISIGLLITGCLHNQPAMIAGAMLAGLGYGIMQPLIYDKTAIISPPQTATLSLSFVMSVNYLAVLVCPFIVDLFGRMLHMSHDNRFPFVLNAVLTAFFAVWAYVQARRLRHGNGRILCLGQQIRKPLTTYIPIHVTALSWESRISNRALSSLLSRHICFYYWTISFKINITISSPKQIHGLVSDQMAQKSPPLRSGGPCYEGRQPLIVSLHKLFEQRYIVRRLLHTGLLCLLEEAHRLLVVALRHGQNTA